MSDAEILYTVEEFWRYGASHERDWHSDFGRAARIVLVKHGHSRMLKYDPLIWCIVYPPGIASDFECSWAELRKRAIEEVELGQSLVQLRIVDGPAGGGVIAGAGRSLMRVQQHLRRYANLTPPEPAYWLDPQTRPAVSYVDPYPDAYASPRRRKPLQVCRASPEHCESTSAVYWALDFRESEAHSCIDDEILSLAKAMRVTLEPIEGAPTEMRPALAAWFGEWSGFQKWYRVCEPEEEVSWNFALLLYCGFAEVSTGRQLRWAHLVSSIEGRPSVRERFSPSRWRKYSEQFEAGLSPETKEMLTRIAGKRQRRLQR